MNEQELSKLTKEDVYEIAITNDLPVNKRMKKGEIIEAILKTAKKKKKKNEILEKSETPELSSGSQTAASVQPAAVPPSKIPGPYIPEMPREYGLDRLVLMVRDPHWIYAYWEITEQLLGRIMKKMGEDLMRRSTLTLRMHDVTDLVFDGANSHSHWDIDVHHRIGDRHINIWGSDRNYVAELGYRTPSGTFVRVLLSNTVLVPRGKVSDRTDANWMIVEETYEKLLEASGMHKVGASSGEGPTTKTRTVPGDVRGLEMSLSSEALSSWSSHMAGQPASAAAAGKKGKQKEDMVLVVNTDLVVYGYATVGSEVTIADNNVKLNPDGTFSIRFALKSGVHKLPVRAVKRNVGKRMIPVEVSKKQGT